MFNGPFVYPGNILSRVNMLSRGRFRPASYFGADLFMLIDAASTGSALDVFGRNLPTYVTAVNDLAQLSPDLENSADWTRANVTVITEAGGGPDGQDSFLLREQSDTAQIHRVHPATADEANITYPYAESRWLVKAGTSGSRRLIGGGYGGNWLHNINLSPAGINDSTPADPTGDYATVAEDYGGGWVLFTTWTTGVIRPSQMILSNGTAFNSYVYDGDGTSNARAVYSGSQRLMASAVSNIAGGSFSQATPGVRPACILAGGSRLRSIGSSYATSSDSSLLTPISGDDPTYTIAFLAKRTGSAVTQSIFGARNAGGTALRIGFNTSNQFAYVRGAAPELTDPGASDTDWHIYEVEAAGTAATLRVDGSTVATATVDAASLTMTQAQLFANGANAHGGNLDIARGFGVSRVLTGQERGYVNQWLQAGAPV